jgi:hypothetical protein
MTYFRINAFAQMTTPERTLSDLQEGLSRFWAKQYLLISNFRFEI